MHLQCWHQRIGLFWYRFTNSEFQKLYLSYYVVYVPEWNCPGNCSDAGTCDTTTGKCTCDPGRHGLDCSSKKIYSK